ncbi:hypothetical protein DENSPDRAFT_286735 [Dentipellis sp. KUC8613]|nr:hypothetical protein DENSPDRAFT_286735 [Dentipellis sp. KUC8613]
MAPSWLVTIHIGILTSLLLPIYIAHILLAHRKVGMHSCSTLKSIIDTRSSGHQRRNAWLHFAAAKYECSMMACVHLRGTACASAPRIDARFLGGMTQHSPVAMAPRLSCVFPFVAKSVPQHLLHGIRHLVASAGRPQAMNMTVRRGLSSIKVGIAALELHLHLRLHLQLGL